MLRSIFKKTYMRVDTKCKPQTGSDQEPITLEGLWRKCSRCGQSIYVEDVKNNYYIYPKYNGYFRVHAYRRIGVLADEGTFEGWNEEMPFSNPLSFPGYEKKVLTTREKSRLSEAIVTGECKIDGDPAVVGVCNVRFIMGNVGHVVGEEIADAIKRAIREKMPVILFAHSGGARMREGIVSLMQIAKTSAVLKHHHKAGQLFTSILADLTTRGVTASFAMLDDIILTEPHALIGFTGPRVIEQTIEQKLPEEFQRSELLLEYGFADKIVERKDQKRATRQILYVRHSHKMNIESKDPVETARTFVDKPSEPQEDGGKAAWDTVLLSRRSDRPVATDYISALFDEFIEPHGDRHFKDGGAIIGGVTMFHGMPVTVIEQQKGKNTKGNVTRNSGTPFPDGYHKALYLTKQAEAFGRSVVCFVDTSGALCGLEAEERGRGEAVAKNLFEISDLKVPMLSIVTGESGSSGALVMTVADKVWMLEDVTYSILPPEGFVSTLYKNSKKAPDTAKVMKVTAKDLLQLKLIERIVSEEQPACVDNLYRLAEYIDSTMTELFKTYLAMSDEEPREHRHRRFRRI